MQRIARLIVGIGLVITMIVAGIGCSSNPMTSESTIPIDQEPDQDVVSGHVGPQDPGGYPTNPATDIDKYETENDNLQKGVTP